MKFLLQVLLIMLLCACAEYFMPWWIVAVVCFLVSVAVRQSGGRAFLMGFLGVALFWLLTILWHDVSNAHILSTRMAALFHMPNIGLFILLNVVVGGIVGGLSALCGALVRTKSMAS